MGDLMCAWGFNTTLTMTYCRFDAPRRVAILTNTQLNNATNGYKAVIYNVEKPKTLDSYKKVYVGVLSGSSTGTTVLA